MTPDKARSQTDKEYENTDRELWREREDDYYANSIHVTERGGIGINVGGLVIVKPLAEWHKLAKEHLTRSQPVGEEVAKLVEERAELRHGYDKHGDAQASRALKPGEKS